MHHVDPVWTFVGLQVLFFCLWGMYWRAKVHQEIDESNRLFSELFDYVSELLENPDYYRSERIKACEGDDNGNS